MQMHLLPAGKLRSLGDRISGAAGLIRSPIIWKQLGHRPRHRRRLRRHHRGHHRGHHRRHDHRRHDHRRIMIINTIIVIILMTRTIYFIMITTV